MIIQCRKCETRFRFDDHLIAGDGVWVRCSRCQHVFFQERAAEDLRAVKPEIPSVRISDARRTPEERFSVAAEHLPPEIRSEMPPRPKVDAESELPVEFEKEPSLEEPGPESIRGPADDMGEEREAEDAEEEATEVGAGRKRWGWAFLKGIALIVFILIVVGTLSLYLFPEIRTRALEFSSPWLKGVPIFESFIVPKAKSDAAVPTPVRIKDIRQRSVANLLKGNLHIIEGIAVNQAPYPLTKIRVRLVIADAYDVVLGEKVVFCGNILSDTELGAMAEAEIQRELSTPLGSDFPNQRIEPKGEIPFMIVFTQEQAGAVKTTILPAGADRAP
jgi:predicted Zn finger-like uncharacterized protein